MTGEPVHTASKERMAPQLMLSSECVSQLSITDSKVKCDHYVSLSALFSPLHSATTNNSKRSTSAFNPVTVKNIQTICVPQLSITDSKQMVITLRLQPVTQCYKQRTVSVSAINPVTTEK